MIIEHDFRAGLVLATALLLSACGGGGGDEGDGGGGNNTPPDLGKVVLGSVDVGNAEVIFLAEPEEGQAANADQSLFKQTPDGSVEPVPMFDTQGNVLDQRQLQPQSIEDLNDEYLLVHVLNDNFSSPSYTDAYYLIQKQTGAAYFWWGFDGDNDNFLSVNQVLSSRGRAVALNPDDGDSRPVADDRIYAIINEECSSALCPYSFINRAHRLEDADPDNLFTQALTPDSDSVDFGLIVDGQGRLAYFPGSNGEELTILVPGGGLTRLDHADFAAAALGERIDQAGEVFVSLARPFVAHDGQIYILADIDARDPDNFQLAREGHLFQVTSTQGVNLRSIGNIEYAGVEGSVIMRSGERIIALGGVNYSEEGLGPLQVVHLYEIAVASATPLRDVGTLPASFDRYGQCFYDLRAARNARVAYLEDCNGDIHRLDLSSYQTELVLGDDSYDVANFEMGQNDQLIAYALRLADSTGVTLQLGTDNMVREISELSGRSVINLVRVQ